MSCLVCGSPGNYNREKYFVIPGNIMYPNCYVLCKEHEELNFTFEDVYNHDGTRKELFIKDKK